MIQCCPAHFPANALYSSHTFKLFCEQNFCDLKVNHEIHKNIVPRKFGNIRYTVCIVSYKQPAITNSQSGHVASIKSLLAKNCSQYTQNVFRSDFPAFNFSGESMPPDPLAPVCLYCQFCAQPTVYLLQALPHYAKQNTYYHRTGFHCVV